MNRPISHQLFETASRYFPGGVNSPVRAWRNVGGEPFFVARGEGDRLFDADQNEYIDYVGSWGPLILGHAFPTVVNAIRQAAVRGTSYGAPHELEIALASRIAQAVPSIEMMRFVNSGTEATMSAIRLARAYTGRSKILKFDGGYHGHADFLLAKAGSGLATFSLPDSAGIPPEIASTTLVTPYNNTDGVERILQTHKGEVAAIIVEPIAGNMGVIPPKPGFLEGLRDLSKRHRAVLIFDEVITGFRVAWGGAQALYGIRPDLTCLGKIIGGGLPVGAFGGRGDIMQLVAPMGAVYQAGTLSGNPIAMAAGIATLDSIAAEENAYVKLDTLGRELQTGLQAAAEKAGIPTTLNRVGSMLTTFFNEHAVENYGSARASDTARYGTFFNGMLEHGIYFAPSQFEAAFVSLAHTSSDIARTINCAEDVFGKMVQ